MCSSDLVAFSCIGQGFAETASPTAPAAKILHAPVAHVASSAMLDASDACLDHANARPCHHPCPSAGACSAGASCSVALGVTGAPTQLVGGIAHQSVDAVLETTPNSRRAAPDSPPPRG